MYHLLKFSQPKPEDGPEGESTSPQTGYSHFIKGNFSPESIVAASMYSAVQESVPSLVSESASGRELVTSGFAVDVEYALHMNVSGTVPVMLEEAFVAL